LASGGIGWVVMAMRVPPRVVKVKISTEKRRFGAYHC
jgi:hypothetical protein